VNSINIGVKFDNNDLGITISEVVTDLTINSENPIGLIMLKSDSKKGKVADKTRMILSFESNRIIFKPDSINIQLLPGVSGVNS